MLNSLRNRGVNCEQEAKFVQDRISTVERNLAELCSAFGAYSRKAARLRDKGDEIAKTTLVYSDSEDINTALSDGLLHFANNISTLSAYNDARVKSIDVKVVAELSQYEEICRNAKEEVKQIYLVRSKEVARKRQLDRARQRNPRNRQQIIQAETELIRASSEVSKTIHGLEEQVIGFERQKLHDIKGILKDFVCTEIGYHAKCLEILTKMYRDVEGINEETDLAEFKKSLRMQDTVPHMATKRTLFRTSQSLGSLGTPVSTPKTKSPGIPTINLRKTSRSEDVLDRKEELDDSDETVSESETEDEGSSQNSKSESHVSPFLAKSRLK